MKQHARYTPLEVLIVLVAAGLVALATVSCTPSNKALRYHSLAAQTLEDAATQGRIAVKERREAHLRAAGEIARDAGGDIAVAVRAAAAEFDEGPLVPAVNAFSAAKTTYVRAVLLAAQKEDPDFGDLKPVLRSAIEAYGHLRDALGDDGERLPGIPPVVLELLR